MPNVSDKMVQVIDESALTAIARKVVGNLWFPGASNGEILRAFANHEPMLIVIDRNVLSYCQNALFKKAVTLNSIEALSEYLS